MTEPSTVLTMSIFLPNLDDAFIQSDVQLRQDTIESGGLWILLKHLIMAT